MATIQYTECELGWSDAKGDVLARPENARIRAEFARCGGEILNSDTNFLPELIAAIPSARGIGYDAQSGQAAGECVHGFSQGIAGEFVSFGPYHKERPVDGI